ncbi:hypothetical protein BTH55_02955 [Lactobacillus delbrueckii subsp. bulgaricus]|nr:hypothetical protein [Lactobacillus delbrueckii subsp. bulgaricus]MBT8856870.1 hypothetical protein [Lactobacillus delbrueckii subsp. bulgaricus]MBT8866593.1 hypothetical protein [Lactobacillus delbrueckii subsp. bulgaricus]
MTEEKKVPTISLIRAELKAPKSQFNSFGKYKYRSVEDIYEGLKPLMVKYCAQYDIDEEIKEICGKTMTEVTVIYKDDEQTVKSHGYAEISMHKGMSPEQCIGTASSYATKYALNKLFQLDDTQDVDSMDNRPQVRQRQSAQNNSYIGQNANQGNHTSDQPSTRQQAQERLLSADEAIKLGKEKKYKEPNTQTVVSAYDLLLKVKAEKARGKGGDYTDLYSEKAQDPKEKKIIVSVYKAMKEKGVI